MLQDILGVLWENVQQTRPEEYVAVLFGLLSVWYARKANILVYPTGIISVVIYVYICLGAKLYADMGINVVYFIMSVYGWYNWTRKDAKENVIHITADSRKDIIISIASIVVGFIILSWVLSAYTDSDVPIIDAFTTSVFIVGMWLMARKKLGNWVAWIVGDIISVPLYAYKGLVLTSFQFLVFLILAIMGYIEWRRMIREREAA